MIEVYLSTRGSLRNICLLVDARHQPTEADVIMLNWIKYYNKNYFVVITKIDKLKTAEREERKNIIKETLKVDDYRLIEFSSETGEGRDRLFNIIKTII